MPKHSRNDAQLRRMVDSACIDVEAEIAWKALMCDVYQTRVRCMTRENHRLLRENRELVMALIGTPSAGDVQRVVTAYTRDRYAAAGRWLKAHPVVMGLAFAFVLFSLFAVGGILSR